MIHSHILGTGLSFDFKMQSKVKQSERKIIWYLSTVMFIPLLSAN